ncbi:MAG: transposase family protein [Verrucomicrobiales bacterium]|nr:transposase family protein [Verrucomicrobiales bacterium]
METPNKTTPRKNYNEAFKRAAVDMLINSGKKAKQIADELGVSTWNLRDWKKVYGPKTPVIRRSTTELEAENYELRQELMRVKNQRDILKKTLGILSVTDEKGTNE